VVEDVPYVASPQATVDEMLRIAQVNSRDVVYDLGSGDGRVLITAAAKFGARGVGIEIDPAMVKLSRSNVIRRGVADRVRILQQDIFDSELAPATVVTSYLAPHINLRLRERLLRLRPGTRIVSHSSDMGAWKPDARTAISKDVLLWVVPAEVSGRWRARVGQRTLELQLAQQFQEISAQAVLDGAPVSVWETKLDGPVLRFTIVDPVGEVGLYFSARVDGDAMSGDVARDVGAVRTLSAWSALRLRP
jgi:SAM-dependent methyltransferase